MAETNATAAPAPTESRNLREGFGLALASWPSDRVTAIVNASQIVLWACLALTQLPANGHFTLDQAYFYELAMKVVDTLRPGAYGPFASGSNPVIMTPGGLLYVVLSVPFFFTKNPEMGVAWIIVLSSSGFWLLDRALKRFGTPNSQRIAIVTVLTWSLWHARFDDTLWNANVYLFATPALVYSVSRIATGDAKSPVWGLLVGLISALQTQIHISGSLAVAGCGVLWLTMGPRTFRPKPLLLAVAGLALGFLPYFWVEIRDGLPNMGLLRNGMPPGADPVAWYRSLGAYVLYPSHAQTRDALSHLGSGAWFDRIFAFSLLLTLGWTALGLLCRYPGKWASLAFLLLLPPFFRITGRAYYDHYVITGLPFYCMPAAAGLAFTLSKPRWRWAAVAYLAVFAVCGGVLLFGGQQIIRPGDPWNGRNVKWQVEQTKLSLEAGAVPSGPGDESAFTRWVIARRMLGKPLYFRVGPYVCDIDFKFSGFEPPITQRSAGKVLIELHTNLVFVCPQPSG